MQWNHTTWRRSCRLNHLQLESSSQGVCVCVVRLEKKTENTYCHHDSRCCQPYGWFLVTFFCVAVRETDKTARSPASVLSPAGRSRGLGLFGVRR